MPSPTGSDDQPAERDAGRSSHVPAPPAPHTSPTDVPVQRSAPGQDGGWQALLPHQRQLLAVAVACGATPDTARDIVQEALLRIATRSGVDPERVAGLLVVTVRRLTISRHRREQRQQEFTRDLRLELPSQPGPEDRVCQQAEAAWLQQQTARLPERERRALLLRGAGRSTREIATEFDVSIKTVELLIRRGRTTLRRLLASG